MEAEFTNLFIESTYDSLDYLSGFPKDEVDLVKALLFDSDDEEDEFVIDDLATLIILTYLVACGEIDQR